MARVGNTGQSRKSTQASDLQDRTLGVGTPDGADKSAGKANARWSRVDLTGGGAIVGTTKEYDVPHDLKRAAVLCEMKKCENPLTAGTVISAEPSRVENWSHSHCHVKLTLVRGSFDGAVASFLVQGA